MKTIDKTVLAGYNAGIEFNRLNEGIGRIEFAYTKELLVSTPAAASCRHLRYRRRLWGICMVADRTWLRGAPL